MNDDLRHFCNKVYEYREHPEKGRLAGVLSVAAIVMLLITNITTANQSAAPQAPPSSSYPLDTPTRAPAEAARPIEHYRPIEGKDGAMFQREIDLLGQSLDVLPEFAEEWDLDQVKAELRHAKQPRARAILEAEKARLMAELDR